MKSTVIVGGGPAGLSIAWYLASAGHQCTIVEAAQSLGGCHRVDRANSVKNARFTEHGPRIYAGNFTTFNQLLSEMNIKHSDVFTKYNVSTTSYANKILPKFGTREVYAFGVQFIKLFFNNNYGKDKTMKQFMDEYNFKPEARKVVERICLLIDGADASRFTLWEFLQITNQNGLYNIYQPKQANDQLLFDRWEKALSSKNVRIIKNARVTNLIMENDKITRIIANGNSISGDRFILAIPPYALVKLLQNTNAKIRNSFALKWDTLQEWERRVRYQQYISVTFHWDAKIDLPRVWGLTESPWGLIYIVLSDYMKDNSKTLVSAAISLPNAVSPYTGKSANQSAPIEIKSELFRQFKEVYFKQNPNIAIPPPDDILIYQESDVHPHAFIMTVPTQNVPRFLPNDSSIPNLYNVGAHNGNSEYAFTSMESAVVNSLALAKKIDSKVKQTVSTGWTINTVVLFLLIVFVIFVVYFIKFRKKNNSKKRE